MEKYGSMVTRLLFYHILISMKNMIAWLVGYFFTTFWYKLTNKSCRNLEGPWDSFSFLVGHGICAQKEVAIHLGKLKQQGGSTYKIWQVCEDVGWQWDLTFIWTIILCTYTTMAMGVQLSSFNSMLHGIKSIILVKVFSESFYFTRNIVI